MANCNRERFPVKHLKRKQTRYTVIDVLILVTYMSENV